MDFLRQTPNKWDIIVTDPPYSQKDEFLQRAYALGKPFAIAAAVDGSRRQGDDMNYTANMEFNF